MIISPANRLDGVTTYYFARKLAEIDAMNKNGLGNVINLGIGSPDLLPPSEVVEKLIAATNDEGAHKYQSYKGILSLRGAISEWYQSHFDVNIHADDQVLPLIGSKEGVMHVSMSFLNPGDEVLVPSANCSLVYPCPPAAVVIVKSGSVAVAARVKAMFLASVVTIAFPLSYAVCRL